MSDTGFLDEDFSEEGAPDSYQRACDLLTELSADSVKMDSTTLEIINQIGAERFFAHVLAIFPEMDEEALAEAFIKGFYSPTDTYEGNPATEFSKKLSKLFSYLHVCQLSPMIASSFAAKKESLDDEEYKRIFIEAVKAFNKALALRVVAFSHTQPSGNYCPSLNNNPQIAAISSDLGVVDSGGSHQLLKFLSTKTTDYVGTDMVETYERVKHCANYLQETYGPILSSGILIPDDLSPDIVLTLIDDYLSFTIDCINAIDTIEYDKQSTQAISEEKACAPETKRLEAKIEDLHVQVNSYLAAVGNTSIPSVKREHTIHENFFYYVKSRCAKILPRKISEINMPLRINGKKTYLDEAIEIFSKELVFLKNRDNELRDREPKAQSCGGFTLELPTANADISPERRCTALRIAANKYDTKEIILSQEFKTVCCEAVALEDQVIFGMDALQIALDALRSINLKEYSRRRLRGTVLAVANELPKFVIYKAFTPR